MNISNPQLALLLDGPPSAPAADRDGTLPELQVRRHPRARRISVRVYPAGRVVVVAPPRAPASAVEAFVSDHRQWIIDTWARLGPRQSADPPSALRFPALQRTLDVRYRVEPSVRAGCREQRRTLTVTVPRDDDALRLDVLRGWLKGYARREVPPLLQPLCAQTGLAPARLQFRLQKSRWGSCSATGTISFNACLLFLDARLMRYLFLHELCHLRQMNHSRRYWALLAEHEPDWRRVDRALNDAWRDVPAWVLAG